MNLVLGEKVVYVKLVSRQQLQEEKKRFPQENSLVQNSSCNVRKHTNTGHTSQQLLVLRVSKNNRLVNKKACDHTKRKTMGTRRAAELKDPASSVRRQHQSKSRNRSERMLPG